MTTERLRLLFCDHLNLARGKYLPASKIGDGSSRFAQATYALTYGKNLIPAPGTKMLEGMPDVDAIYQASDVRPGWDPATSVVIADLFDTDGTPLPLCGRGLLIRTVAEAISRPKVQINSSFLLHAPLELLARAWHLPRVPPDRRG